MLKVNFSLPEVQKISLVTPRGKEWVLTQKSDHGAFLRDSGFSGLVGSPSALVSQSVGGVGQDFHGAENGAMEGGLGITLYDLRGHGCTSVVRDFYSDFTTGEFFHLLFPFPTGQKTIKLRLSSELALPSCDPADTDLLDVDLSVVSDEGVWWSQEFYGENNVTVTNQGHIPASPKIMWNGPGGRVILPSGASFTLPPAPEPRFLLLGANKSLAVLDSDGNLDREVWLKVRGAALPESVPPKTSRTYTVPKGAVLFWKIGYLNPMVG
ncbi:hypothetical protein BRL54_11365 [Corynebacterium ulcerans]|nr:hypothetical protein BRL54_11365 [Corynebacterium ulcerans]